METYFDSISILVLNTDKMEDILAVQLVAGGYSILSCRHFTVLLDIRQAFFLQGRTSCFRQYFGDHAVLKI